MNRVVVVAASFIVLAGCASGSTTTSTPESSSTPINSSVAPSITSPAPTSPSAEASPELTKDECAQVWYDHQYGEVAPGFPTTVPPVELDTLYAECGDADLLPSWEESVDLTQLAFNTVAQILEKEIYRASKKTGTPPCEAMVDVLKPVGANGAPLMPGDDVEGYASDSFLPILKYQWFGGPFRLKIARGCQEYPWANLWLLADPYPPEGDHPDRYPSDKEVKKDPWSRLPVEGPMSTCITWGPELGNEAVGGRGYIFSFEWDRTNLPNDVRDCYPKALGLNGLDKYPFDEVPNL